MIRLGELSHAEVSAVEARKSAASILRNKANEAVAIANIVESGVNDFLSLLLVVRGIKEFKEIDKDGVIWADDPEQSPQAVVSTEAIEKAS